MADKFVKTPALMRYNRINGLFLYFKVRVLDTNFGRFGMRYEESAQ
ncbi:hypothetical protein BSBH6_00664 [Bacillus subtilis]|nr:hypothetical protein BSBH6_00664 [Bacillus subtilis]RPK27027.1 hypothetical protein BH5_00662 [Bacillus subtilis]